MIKPHFSTLIELLRYRSVQQPNKKAYTFLEDGHIEANHLTYQQLDQEAKAIAAQLQKLLSCGERVLLIYPQGLEVIAAFYGCLYAEVIAIPVPPPDPARLKKTLPRLQAVIQDTQASLIATTSQIKFGVEPLFSQIAEFQSLKWLATDTIPVELAQEWKEPEVNSNTLAYLQYTSGSTSAPKGVMISHGNLMYTCASSNEGVQFTPESNITTWLPYFHDYGLVAGLIQPLYADIPCFLMSPLAFIKRPERWLQAISRYRSTYSAGANFAYEYCVRKITAEQREALDLSSWCVATIGAEPISQETVENFTNTFRQCGFQKSAFDPGYGLAEATLTVSCALKVKDEPIFRSFVAADLEQNLVVEACRQESKARIKKLAGCGQPIPGTKVIIVNPEKLTQCLPNEVGEIWVSGPHVALGYWNNPEATKQTFHAYLTDTNEGPFLRTGDLGFLKDGELFITGRLKDLIIVGGANHYPQDIELTVEKCHPSIQLPNSSATFSIDLDGREKLVVVVEVESGSKEEQRDEIEDFLMERSQKSPNVLNVEEVIKTITQAILQHHELRVYAVVLVESGSIPKTDSGKIQRSACRKSFLKNSLTVVAEWHDNSLFNIP
ncbi:AMP-dependent synthetase [Calothrix sp. HK-06]|nr:AMP-dependent synthetase [Calothrix sp. HK-06]